MTEDIVVSGPSIVVMAGEQTFCSLGDEVVVLSLRAGVYYGLNSVAARVWELLRQPRAVNDILAVLLDEYEVDAKRCEHDLLRLLRELAARALITISNDGSS